MSARVLAVVPAKGISRRLHRKNMRLLAGRPLLHHALLTARECRLIDHLCVSTDSDEIRHACLELGVDVPGLRPAELATDDVHAAVPVVEMLRCLGGSEAWDYCAMLLPTSPLRSARSIDRAIRLAMDRETNVVSVTPLGKALEHLRCLTDDGHLSTVVDDVPCHFQSQDVSELHVLNGSVYVSPTRPLLEHGTFHHGQPLALVMSPEESVDVDDESDLLQAEWLLQRAHVSTVVS